MVTDVGEADAIANVYAIVFVAKCVTQDLKIPSCLTDYDNVSRYHIFVLLAPVIGYRDVCFASSDRLFPVPAHDTPSPDAASVSTNMIFRT